MANTKVKAHKECKICINTGVNPSITFNADGVCNVCEAYRKGFDSSLLAKELSLFKSFIGSGTGKHDVMVGLSGGKDSSAALYRIKEMGFTPLAFTFDTGYFPQYIFRRARQVAEKKCDVDYEIIDVRKYVTDEDRMLFRKMADLYSRNIAGEFFEDYMRGRSDYNGMVRPCWVCRRILIRSYYTEALKHGVKAVVLGINEWTNLRKSTSSGRFVVSAMRRLKPFKDKPAIYIVHLPFLLQAKLRDTKEILRKIGWNYYRNVQSNSYSCLLSHAAERQMFRNLGFHPDTTRLAREVTVGFLTKAEARAALTRPRRCRHSVAEVLETAELINNQG